MSLKITRLCHDDSVAASRLLAQSYFCDAGLLTLFEGVPDGIRQRWCGDYFTDLLEACMKHGRPLAAYEGDELVGAALIYPPGHYPLPLRSRIALSLRLLAQSIRDRIGFKRIAHLSRLLAELEVRHPKEPNFYIEMIGIEESHRHHGIGSALVRAALAQAQRARVGVYLETSNPANLHFYSHLGFEIREQIGSGPISYWLLWHPAEEPLRFSQEAPLLHAANEAGRSESTPVADR